MTDYKGPNAFSRGGFKPAKPPKSVGVYARSPDGVVRQNNGPAFNNKFPKSRYPRGGGQSSGDTDGLLLNMIAPLVTGTPTVGETLSCSTGTWTGSPTGYAYQWERDGVAIGGATSSTYLLVNDDGGTSVSCLVTASKDATSASQISNALDVSSPPYAAKAIHASGNATLTLPVGSMTGIADSPFGLMSVWLLQQDTNANVFTIMDNANQDCAVKLDWDVSNGHFNYDAQLYQLAQTNHVTANNTVSPLTVPIAWTNFIFSWDMNHAPGSRVFQCAINGTVAANTFNANAGTVAFNVDIAGFDLMCALVNDNFFTGDMADYYFTAPAAFFDLANPTNIAKFIDGDGKPVDLGADGSTPTGTQPYVFFSRTGSTPAEFETNKGSGGPFTFTGTALTNASTSPSD